MRYFLTASKDATIYSGSKNQNTGIDQILEVSAWHNRTKDDYSRALIQFDISKFETDTSASRFPTGGATSSLQLTSTKLRELAREFHLEIKPISGSWDMGLGKRQDDPITTDGVSFRYRLSAEDTGSAWSYEGAVTASAGVTQSYNQTTVDVNQNISDIVNQWAADVIPNHGLLVKFPDSAETGSLNYGAINFFSKETHTIYEPKIAVDWDDSDNSARTGSVEEVSADNFYLNMSNLKRTYTKGNVYRFNIFARDEFPSLTFESGSAFSKRNVDGKYIPTGSQYSVVDNVTEDVIVPFSNFSKISSDETESYFELDFTGWESERYYRIKIKVDDGSNVSIVDKNFTFKLVE